MTVLLLIAGCDLFRTRDAEPPDSGRGSWETPRVPMDVLDNMSSALFERNTVNYLRSFGVEAFVFEADPVALARDATLGDWTYDDESQHAAKLFSEGTLPSDSLFYVVFAGAEETILGDSAEIHVDYDLTAGVALAGVPHRVAGRADFYLQMGREGYWQITRWRDNRTEDVSTWSDFKSLVR